MGYRDRVNRRVVELSLRRTDFYPYSIGGGRLPRYTILVSMIVRQEAVIRRLLRRLRDKEQQA